MIKKMIKKIVNSLGYDIVKKYDSGHNHDAVIYNKVENVNQKNQYENYFIKNLKSDSVFIECIFSKIDELFKDNMKLLDVGCGSGVLVNKLKNKYKQGHIFGCDFSESKINQCKKHHNKNIFFVHNIYTQLTGEYDFIVCTEVLEHLEYPNHALSNLVNALDENGILFISVPNGRLDTFEGHIHFWSKESFKLFVDSNMDSKYFLVEFFEYCSKNIALIKKEKI